MRLITNQTFTKLPIILLLVVFQQCNDKQATCFDKTHYSKVFGKEKAYSIYLPSDYEYSEKKYPVIYFFHGWGGRHFMDPNAQLDYNKICGVVEKYKVIMVLWDGNIEEPEKRPYNIGYHKDIKYTIQMQDYFPELTAHIDSTYRTSNDRDHRGIIGFSMGGFMSYYISGKYPDRISAAVDIVGSPEFFVGLPDNHTHYPIKYTFDNLRDVSLLLINRTGCPLTWLNTEVNQGALWSGVDDYKYRMLEGEHKVDNQGEISVFDSMVKFVLERFNHPEPIRKEWTHYDIAAEFNLWGYHVKSNKSVPGFLCLRKVNEQGFGFYSYNYLPDGLPLKICKASVTTAPIYQPNQTYKVAIYYQLTKSLENKQVLSDSTGRLHIDVTGDGFEVGIEQDTGQFDFSVLGYKLNEDEKYLKINQPNQLIIDLFKRAGNLGSSNKMSIELSCSDTTVTIFGSKQELTLQNNPFVFFTLPFRIESNKQPPSDDSPVWLRMQVGIEYEEQSFSDEFILPVYYDVPYFENIQVDDGSVISPTHIQYDFADTTANIAYGSGNGDGIISPSEQIMLYQDGHRLRLYTEDPFVVTEEEKIIDEILPAIWPDAYTFSSVVKIADNCPDGHKIEFLGHYETKTHMPINRQVKWGKIKVVVKK